MNLWFQTGAIIALILVPASVFVLVRSLLSSLNLATSTGRSAEIGLTAAVPGVNLPLSEIGFYLLAIICASVIHEAGHAIAAAHANVQVDGVGFTIIAVIPVAFVELATESFCRADVKHRLWIVCAGVWHNVMLALICALLLVGHPVILFPFCTFGTGATVTSASPNENGLTSGDQVFGVNDCVVTGKEIWHQCVSTIASNNLTGYCVTDDFLEKDRVRSLVPGKCCSEDLDRNLCFNDRHDEPFCLPARKVVDNKKTCLNWDNCPLRQHCLKPDVGDDRIRLFRVSRKERQSFIFLGTGPQLLASATVADFEVRSKWIPISFLRFYDCLLRYLISFSLALAVLNVVPCFYLDGQFILTAAMEMFGGEHINRFKRLSKILLYAGTSLLLVSVAVAIKHLFFRSMN